MTTRTLVSVSLALFLGIALLAALVPATAAQEGPGDGEVNVFLEGASGGQEQVEYEVFIEDADDGIGAYEFNVSSENTSVAEILDYELNTGGDGDGPFDGSRITSDGETLAFEVALGNASHGANETDGTEFAVATVTVGLTGGENVTTNLTTAPVTEGQTVATPGFERGVQANATFYEVLNLPAQTPAPPQQTEIDLAVEPAGGDAPLQSPPGEERRYEVVAYNATDGISAYNLSVELGDPAVAQFVDIDEPLSPTDSDSEIRGGDGSPADTGPLVRLDATVGESPGDPRRTVLAELTVAATGDISEETVANITAPAPRVFDNDDDRYTVEDIDGSGYVVTADMELTLRDQFYGDATGGVDVTVRDVDSDAQQGSILVTYEDQNQTVVAGVASGVYSDQDVQVTLEDLGGLDGTHTAHILLSADLSTEYAPGDSLSAATAESVIDRATATLTEPPVPDLSGLDIEITSGLTVGDEYPLNGRGIFESPTPVYGPSTLSLPPGAGDADERYAPIPAGRHVGLGGLPVQDEVYQWAAPLVDFQAFAPTQAVAVSFDGDSDSPVRLDYTEARAHGLQVAEILTVAGDSIAPEAYDTTLDRAAGEIVVTFDESAVGPESPTVWFELVWAAADPVEGLSVDEPNRIDYETDHRVVGADGDQERDNFVTFETGATGISYVDTDNSNSGFIGQPADKTELTALVEADEAADGRANDGSFLVWQNQRVTFETESSGDTVELFEVDTDDTGNYALGDEIDADVVGFGDTAPGQVANLNTSTLTAGQRYFVTFGGDTGSAVVLDVRPLDLAANTRQTVPASARNEPLEVNVTAADTTGGEIEAWFRKEELGSDVGDIVHVERAQLTGNGNRTLEVVPSVDLAGPGNYTALVLHAESGVTTTTTFELAETPTPTLAPATDVRVVSPSLLDIDEPGIFDRGDIVPVELELEGGNVATVTFGDQGDQNLEVHATVYDPTYDESDVANNSDTSVTVYLNTYQIGQGYVADGSGALVANRPDWISAGDWENRQHGFFTNPADVSSALVPATSLDREQTVYATDGLDIYGGSQGGAVISPGERTEDGFPGLRYDLHAAGSFLPHTAPGVERDDVNALDIEQRATSDVTVLTAPGEGENAFDTEDPVTTDEVERLKQRGVLTELDIEEVDTDSGTQLVFNGTVAEDDYLVVEVNASGTEGVLHEAVVRDSGLEVPAFLNRTDDHLVTEEFRAAIQTTLPRVESPLLRYDVRVFENTTSYADRIDEPEENVERFEPERVNLDLTGRIDRVVSGVDADGNLQEYLIPYQLEPGDELLADSVDPDRATLEGGLSFDTALRLEPSGGEQSGVGDRNVPTLVNPALDNGSLGFRDISQFDYVTPTVAVDDQHLGPAGLEVPGEENYTITGTSTMAGGTQLDLEMLSLTGEGTPFFKQPDLVQTVNQSGDQPATWSVTVNFNQTRNDVEIDPRTEFTTDIKRTTGSTPLGGEALPGVVLADPAVGNFTVNSQRSDGEVVVVEAFNANRVAQLEVQDADGNVLGTSGTLERGLNEQFNIVLEDPISSNQEVTVVATVEKPEQGEVLAEETAEILVQDQAEPFFDVSGLSPQTATVEVGDTVTVEATVENLGDIEATQSIGLDIDGISDSESVTLAGGASETVSFTVDTSDVDPGEYTHTVSSEDSEAAGSLTIEAQPEPGVFEIINLSPEEATVTTGDELVVDVSVQNVGEQEATETVTLEVSGLGAVGNQSLTLAGGDAGSVSFTVDTSPVDPGDYTHTVSTAEDSVEGSLTVEAQPTVDNGTDNETDNATDDGDDGSGAGFGVVVAALALLGAALLVARRRAG